MKKIAINLSGAIRTFEYCDSTILNNIIKPLQTIYDVDLFGHFWIMNNLDDSSISVKMKWKEDTLTSINRISNFGFKKYIIKEYNKKYEDKIIKGCNGSRIIDKYFDDINSKNYAVNCMGMYYKIMKCHKLMQKYEIENNIKYDYVIRLRPDFYWKEPIPLDIIHNISNNDIIIVRDSFCINAKWNANDKFFMGTNILMSDYSFIYNNISDFFDENVIIEGQNLAKYMIDKMQLNVIYFGNELTYEKAAGKFLSRYIKRRNHKIFLNWLNTFDL